MKRQRLIVFGLVSVIVIVGLVAMAGPNTAIFKAILVQNDAAVGGELVVGGGLTVTGGITGTNVLTTGDQTIGGVKTFTTPGVMSALDVTNAVNYGTANLYPVGNPVDGKKWGSAVTAVKVQSATAVPTIYAIKTVTAFGCAPDDAAFAGAWDCRAAMGSTNNITFTLYENDATPVPTAAYDEIRYWVAGN